MAIKTVAVVGASGNVGAPTVKALLEANFTVIAITRQDSKSTFPAEVEVRRVDLSSVDSLTKGFQGVDAVVSTLTTAVALSGGQDPVIDAAIAAGVKRFIPSEFGTNHQTMPADHILKKLMGGKIAVIEYLHAKAKENPSFTWTGLATGMFFDWGLDFGMLGIKLKDKTATIFDTGNEPFPVSTLSFVGRIVATVLQNEAETANQYYDVVQFNVSQNQILSSLEEETGSKFTITKVPTDSVEKSGHEKLAKGDHLAFLDFLTVYVTRDGAAQAVKDENNAVKTVLKLESGDVKDVLKEYVKSRSA